MADTGAPWNLPYPLPTDLVRDGADAIKDLAEAAAAGLDLAGNPGIGSNVVQTVKTDTFTTTSSTLAEITGLTVTITPTTDTSKILVLYTVALNGRTATAFAQMRLMRGATPIYIGATDGSRTRGSNFVSGDAGTTQQASGVFLDSPGVDTAVTYSLELATNTAGAAVYVNRSHTDTNSAGSSRMASAITVIEVAP